MNLTLLGNQPLPSEALRDHARALRASPRSGTCAARATAENQGCRGLEAQGSVDVPVIRDQMANILESGRDAFIQRKKKYEF
ncbi:hypothetical protein [Burkholderia cenocepacia]|uniref:hypothetical protein n=1 Tax=Burkholderia cenocepacia TaxID=95486 RepID=UPI00114CEE2F|nr:hypothetical protein [Burkholderia cenocepacia]